jgi:hypothetical protein
MRTNLPWPAGPIPALQRVLAFTLVLSMCRDAGAAQAAASGEQVTYRNAQDSTYLSATLTLPSARGPRVKATPSSSRFAAGS